MTFTNDPIQTLASILEFKKKTVQNLLKIIKADRPHPRNYLHTPTDDRHTYQHLRLAMALIALSADGRTDTTKDIISLTSRSIMVKINTFQEESGLPVSIKIEFVGSKYKSKY